MNFKLALKEELNELGEIPLILIIPYYLCYGRGMLLLFPIDENRLNYDITDDDFNNMRKELNELIDELNIFLYKRKIEYPKVVKIEDLFIPLTDVDQKQIIDNQKSYLPLEDCFVYFISTRS